MRWRLSLPIAAALLALGCDQSGPRADAPTVGDEEITVTSSAFAEGQPIPRQYTCDGAEQSPPLAWTGVPEQAAALALVIDDPDAPGGTYVHWVVVDIGKSEPGLAAGRLPAGAVQVENSSGDTAYAGPCPPNGTHHYRFTVYALSKTLDVSPDDGLDAVFDQIAAAAIAQGRLTATYARDE
jgi:Raf kinase inhibitor-like YbhB/YbcL family protein